MITNLHWTNGGTGVTNFSANQYDLYCDAILKSGRKDLVIYSKPIPGEGGYIPDGYYSLHHLNAVKKTIPDNLSDLLVYISEEIDGPNDLGDFWEIFDDLKVKYINK